MQEGTCYQTLAVYMSPHPVFLEEGIQKAFQQWKREQFSEKVRQMRREEVSEHSGFK